MGSTAPNLPLNSKLNAVEIGSGESVNLVCAAQANPLPNFRSVDIYFMKMTFSEL
jgi:tRNA G46 methylase TrmB